jgi:uncharacterized protein (TIGR00369 family)
LTQILDQDRIAFLREDFIRGFPDYCGIRAGEINDGTFNSLLNVRPEHKQQDGFVHAGVIATMADHTAGYSAYTKVPKKIRILTIEFKINYFKPAIGNIVICKSKVVSKGKRILVAESNIYIVSEGKESQISKAIVTLAAVPSRRLD